MKINSNIEVHNLSSSIQMMNNLIIVIDGDLITIFDSSDLSFAIQCSRILKLQILLNNKKENKLKILSHGDINNIKQQLRNIRNEVNSILENLDESVTNSISTTSESSE